MQFKVHLLIILCIIIVMSLVLRFMQNSTITNNVAAVKPSHTLSIIHASWGLNCKSTVINNDANKDAFLNKNDQNTKLKEDNVLGPVSRLCNGNVKCDITLGESSLGADPEPNCNNKILEIQYRCFSYDRPWNVKSKGSSISLKCDQPSN